MEAEGQQALRRGRYVAAAAPCFRDLWKAHGGPAMRLIGLLAMCATLGLAVADGYADGCFFYYETGEAVDLAQTRQQVLMASYEDDGASQVTYVVQSAYSGDLSEFAWVLPVPAAPQDILAHNHSRLFDDLDEMTRPQFMIEFEPAALPEPYYYDGPWWMFGCYAQPVVPLALDAGNGDDRAALESSVDVVETGETGIFDYTVLTSTGSEALLTWLNDNGYAVSADAATVLQHYIDQEWHFLAVRVSDDEAQSTPTSDEVKIPPIQFTCQTAEMVYPMIISQVSAAAQTEVLVYTLNFKRMQASDLTNATIDEDTLDYVAASESLTNYEDLFEAALGESDGPVLVTEYADEFCTCEWAQAPSALDTYMWLTRMRTVITPEQMDSDWVFEPKLSNTRVDNDFYLFVPRDHPDYAGVASPMLVMLGLYGVMRQALRRRYARR
jgi:hypothetical protein